MLLDLPTRATYTRRTWFSLKSTHVAASEEAAPQAGAGGLVKVVDGDGVLEVDGGGVLGAQELVVTVTIVRAQEVGMGTVITTWMEATDMGTGTDITWMEALPLRTATADRTWMEAPLPWVVAAAHA